MADSDAKAQAAGRRGFLKAVSGVAASGWVLAQAAGAAEAPPSESPPVDPPPLPKKALLPTIQLGEHRITRLVAGWNPIGGHSHTTLNMARVMREYFTVEQTVAFLRKCESERINAWQFDHTEKGIEAIRLLREQGTDMKFICLHAARSFDAPIDKVVKDTAPIAIVHHGGVTDAMFRAGKPEEVRDFVKRVKDAGLLAGVSAHNPDNIKLIADQDWENDLFMCCFYYVTRPREEQQETLGKVTVGEPFFESDPTDMTAVMRQVQKPCLGFKILAAGRSGWSKYSVEKAFRFAFENIKPGDGVIVGIFPKYADEVAQDAELTRKYGGKA